MSDSELGELARHMGHELSVHRHFYRLQEDITELSKISKLLLLVDKGQAHQYSGKNLDDIRMEGNFYNNRCQMPCGSLKKLSRTSSHYWYIFWYFWIILSTHSVLKRE